MTAHPRGGNRAHVGPRWPARVGLLLALGSSGLAGVRAEDPAPAPLPPLTVAEARRLLPEAAGLHPGVLDEIVRLGALVRVRDLAVLGSFPLTYVALAADASWSDAGVREPRTPLGDVRLAGPHITPTDVLGVLRVMVEKDGKRQAKYAFDSVLAEEFLGEVTVEPADGAFRGTAAFRLPEVLEGRVEWTAAWEAGAWRIVSFWFPHGRVGTSRRDGRWELVAGAQNHPFRRRVFPAEVALAWDELPRVGTLGSLSTYDFVSIGITVEGRLLTETGVVGFGGLQERLDRFEPPFRPEPDRSRGQDLVLRVEASAPWELVSWVLQLLEGGEEHATYRRVAFAVAPAQTRSSLPRDPRLWGEPPAAEGVLATHVPPAPAGAARPGLRVTVRPHGQSVSAAGCYAALREALQALPQGERWAVVVVPAPGGVATQHVLTVVDLLFRAGAESVVFEPIPRPKEPQGAEDQESADWLWAYAGGHGVRGPGFAVELPGKPPIGPLEPPAGEVLRDRPAGYVRPGR